MSWYLALLDGFLKIQIHPEEENFSTSEPRIWMYPPDKTIPTNDNFFLRSNIHAVIVSSIEKSVDIRPPSPFSDILGNLSPRFMYINTQFRTKR